MRFVDDRQFRAKLAALAKTAEGLKLGLTETGEGHFLVSNGKRDFKVVLALTESGNIDASCECETFKNGNLCVHIAYALKSKYDLATDSFNIPKLSAVLDKIIPELGFRTEEKREEEKEISEERAKEVSTAVQKLVATHTEEELAVLLAIGPNGCSWEKLMHKVRIVASLLKSLGWEFVDLSDETVWEVLCSAKNKTLWVRKRKHCITTEFGARVYHRLLDKISEKNAEVSRFIDQLHKMSVSDLRLLADWFARAKSVEFLSVNSGEGGG